jgi:hypothetical protein
MRSIKALGLVLVAALAMSAVVASAALASFDSESKETTLEGTQGVENVFTSDVGNVKCKTVTFSGTQIGVEKEAKVFTAELIELEPTYSECNLSGQAVSVTTNKCKTTYHPAETLVTKSPEVKHLISKVTTKCPPGFKKVIKDKAGLGCEITIGEQNPTGRVKFTNEGTGTSREVLVTNEVTGIAYEWTKGCPNAKEKAGSNTNGTISGTKKIKGRNPATKAQVGINVTMKAGE